MTELECITIILYKGSDDEVRDDDSEEDVEFENKPGSTSTTAPISRSTYSTIIDRTS